jgi:hypothetical protein
VHSLARVYASAGLVLRAVLVLALVAASFAVVGLRSAAAAGDAANNHTVLILGPTVSGGASSPEAAAAIANGMDVEVVDAAGWAAKTTANFATYRALILGDATCGSDFTAAKANALVWSAAVNGRVIIIGSDPVYHYSRGGNVYTASGVKFASGETTKTGAYITLSCEYSGYPAHTPVPELAGFGTFTVTGVPCASAVHIVATHPALSGVTDVTLSNWSCSVHEAFDLWPTAGFDVLAIAKDVGTSYTASDGTVGTPYILARGATVISDISLTPTSGSPAVGSSYTLTATVQPTGATSTGLTVTFTAIGGPNNGMTLTGVTNSSGQATATYTSTTAGTDTWVARFSRDERTQTSNRATVAWGGESITPSTSDRAIVTATSPACGQAVINGSFVTPGLPMQIVVTPSAGGTSTVANVTSAADQKVTATFNGLAGGSYTAFIRNASNQVTVSNTAIFTIVACAVTTPSPTPTPSPVRTPTPTPTPTTAPIANLPSTTTGGEAGLPIALGLAALTFIGIVLRRRLIRG